MNNDATSAPFDWRAHLKVHPAADLFPTMSESELKELAEDIRKNGLQSPILIWRDTNTCQFKDYLVDGRHRLDALAMLGWIGPKRDRRHRERHWDYQHALPLTITYPEDVPADQDKSIQINYELDDGDDIWNCVVSLNVHRRHLTAEKKRELIAKVLRRQPETSDRQIGEMVKADNKTVAAVRAEMEGREEIPHVETRTDSKGRKQPSKKTERKTLDLPSIEDRVRKREAQKGPRKGDWVIMPDGSFERLTSEGISQFSSWIGPHDELPVDGVRQGPNRLSHPGFTTASVYDGSHGMFYLEDGGTIGHSGGNNFHNVSRRAKLVDVGETKVGEFNAFEINNPELNPGVDFELRCRVYRLLEEVAPLQPTDDAEASAEKRKAEPQATTAPELQRQSESVVKETSKLHREVADFLCDFEPRLRSWSQLPLTNEAKDCMHDILMVAADQLMTWAQVIDGRGDAQIAEAA
jgi:ParB-like nuclease domain